MKQIYKANDEKKSWGAYSRARGGAGKESYSPWHFAMGQE